MIRLLCLLLFKLGGWKFKSNIPDSLRSFVFIGAPHTSNFDFIPAMASTICMKRNTKFVIKNSWLKFPMNLIFGPMGAIGIDRSRIIDGTHKSMTEVMAHLFKEYPELVIMISPEGTRSPNENWKTGFYHIAKMANVPIVMACCDYANKEVVLGKALIPTDFDKDMKEISDFYRNIKGKTPENFKLDKMYP